MVRDCRRPPAVAGGVIVLLVICIVDCASAPHQVALQYINLEVDYTVSTQAKLRAEQGLIGKGSKTAALVERPNSWRSQRGGSCLSYGHSCWGAHGKRSGKPFLAGRTHDWYLSRLLKRMAGLDLHQLRQPVQSDNSDMNAIYRVDVPEEMETNRLIQSENEEAPPEAMEMQKSPNAIPMLDDSTLVRAKLLQIMREASETN